MRKITTILFMLMAISSFSQSIYDHQGKIRMRYNNGGTPDTLLIQFSGDSTYYYSNTNPFHKFKSGVIADSLKLNGGGGWIKNLIPSQWTTSGSNIYYNTGNVGINNSSPSYKLDIGGIIGGNNIETNLISQTTRLGHQSGNSESEGGARYNTFIGYNAGYTNITGFSNTFIGHNSGYNNLTSFGNTYIGNYSGYHTTGTGNTFIGANSGRTFTTGYNNTVIGYGAGNGIPMASYGNVFLGYTAGRYEPGNEKLYIDNQDRTSEVLARTNSLIYGTFAANPLDQTLSVNADFINNAPHVAVYRNTDLTIAATQNVWYKITGFTSKDAGKVIVQGDSIQLTKKGHYLVNFAASFSGLNNEIWEIGVFKNNNLEEPSQLRTTTTADVGNAGCPVYVSSDGDDWISFRIRNTTDNDDPTIKRFSGIISVIHLEQ